MEALVSATLELEGMLHLDPPRTIAMPDRQLDKRS
jgi:hypothetical protein